jgi:type VI secretion system secreted protein Hcp
MAIYLEYEGITGDVTADGHDKWIEVTSASWGVGRGISTVVGAAENRESTTVSVSEVVFSTTMDTASGYFWNDLCHNEDGKTAKIHFTSTGDGSANVYLEVTLEDSLISGMSFSSAGDRPAISLSVNFTKIETKYMEQATGGAEATGGDAVIYNLATAKAG